MENSPWATAFAVCVTPNQSSGFLVTMVVEEIWTYAFLEYRGAFLLSNRSTGSSLLQIRTPDPRVLFSLSNSGAQVNGAQKIDDLFLLVLLERF